MSEVVPVLNGKNTNVFKTHPTLYMIITLSSLGCILLGMNFILLNPTFLIYNQSNYLWGGIFWCMGVGTIIFMNVYRSLRMMRVSQAITIFIIIFIGVGTCQPFIEGEGSLQLPLLYFGWAVTLFSLNFEPFINSLTAKKDI